MRKKNSLLRVFTFLALLAVSFIGYCEGSTSGPFIELTPTIGLAKGSQANLQALGGSTWNVTDEVALGFGAGVITSFKFNATPFIPVLFRSKFDLGSGNITPFLLFDAGYNFNLDDMDHSSILISPTVGIRTHGFYLGVGYLAAIATQGETSVGHNLAFRLGYQFGGKKGTKMRTPNFIKRSHFKLEIGFAQGFTKKEFNYIHFLLGDIKTKYSQLGTNAFARATWMFAVNDNVGLGIGTGFDMFLPKFKYYQNNKDNNFTENRPHPMSIPIYVRPQYNFNQINSEIKPFVACDLGYRIPVSSDDYYRGLMLEPQVGVVINDKWSVAAGFNLAQFKFKDIQGYSNDLDDMKQSTYAASLRVGYTF